ncbi:NAD-dependent epimerase/dehydratase family protein [Synechococcus sp. HK05]|uniref:NAD-dependent epimerase/dehydratase family protein n=1 Tax=Synechococcus sp. HK05 TaxID=2725975 RepID=UPI001C3908F5|nr:NAD-dependent epimerase/dehydratase family protein [Synechococcus sp. HK05]MBV2351286.1 NAD-dependent epimerase/dehydratase family protein [Synechococcus sp. HK05]
MSAQPFAGRTVAVTGASGSLGSALLLELHHQGAALVALTSSDQPLALTSAEGQAVPLEQVRWRCGEEQALRPVLERCDVLVINHGFNSHGNRSAEAVLRSLEVNALSSWRLLELFAAIANTDPAKAKPRELWMNTSEAEIQAAVSPLYEISKRLQGQLLSLRSLDLAGSKLRIRRLVLGPFRSALNPIGVMSAAFVAREILRQVHWNWGLVIVTPNPLTYLLMPVASASRWLYFRATTQATEA